MKRLRLQMGELSALVSKNNFSSTQTFNKDSIFSSRLRVPVFTVAPTVAEIGDVMCLAAELYLCTTASTAGAGAVWTVVGTQS